MKLSDFEESEFRAPLFNQLENGNHLLWEPGQVFEKHIGIDRALYCTVDYLWNLKGHNQFLDGARLSNYRWNFIWQQRNSRKKLPNFNLNLFIQAKRPFFSPRSRRPLRSIGLNGKHWYFEIKPHQQQALERVARKLIDKALVVYAAPAFHRQSDLYLHTINRSMIENSTFPDIIELSGHSKWYYNMPGTNGVANAQFRRIEQPDLFSRINYIAEFSEENSQSDFMSSLTNLRNNIVSALSNQSYNNNFETARFFDELEIIERYIRNYELKDEAKVVRSFLGIAAFTNIFKLIWYTIGK